MAKDDDGDLGALVQRARRGDRVAQDALARRVEPEVRRVLTHRIGDDLRGRIDTDDLLQSTISAALTELRDIEYRGEGEFLAWIRAVARNRLLTATRRHRAGRRDPDRERPAAAAAGRAQALTSPPEEAARSEESAEINAALRRLPDEERRVLELRSWEGLPFRAIADRMGLPDADTARRRYRTALLHLGQQVRKTPG